MLLRSTTTTTKLASLLNSCTKFQHLRSLLAYLITTGITDNSFALRRITELVALRPAHPLAFTIAFPLASFYFPLIPSSTTFLYNLLFRTFANSPHPKKAFILFNSFLKHTTAVPDNFTFPALAVACGAMRECPSQGLQIHSQVGKRGFGSDIYTLNTFLSMYSAFGDMLSARKLFDESCEVVDVVSWNTVIDGYVKYGDLEHARKVFDKMPVRNEVSWSAIIGGYAGNGDLDVARSLFNRMPKVVRNVVTWNLMVSGFARKGLISIARKMFDEMPIKNVVSWNAMVSGYAMNGEVDSAREFFDLMPERDVVSWSCMISGYAKGNRFADALNLFKEMQIKSKVRPNEVTLVSVLSACAHLAALDQGKWIHTYIDKNHMSLDDDKNLGAALIDMYAKCGEMQTAAGVFNSLGCKNISSWNALLTGYAVNGEAYESLHAFERMISSGIKPNDVTLLGVLIACTHQGLVDEGRKYFESMLRTYDIQAEVKHYGCMVDLLGRAGMLEEAEELIRSMPMKPDVMVLGAFLGACRIHRDVVAADRVRNDFLELKSQEASCHVLLSNVYASRGRWADASEMRKLLEKHGIRKEAGCSSVELNGTTHEFIAGDLSHPEADAINSWIYDITKIITANGYSPIKEDVLVDVDEEDKETWLLRHSEKLALAFALLNAPQSTIRIVKNLRICGDCHTFIKHVSMLFPQEILVRDRIRFHHFKLGSCSCRDYW